jgi:hypothetical protein
VSAFTLWHTMAGNIEPQPVTTSMERGHYLEPAVAQWTADRFELELDRGGCWRNRARPWQVASPDRIGWANTAPHDLRGVVEVKTAADYEEWGPDGSDLVPPYYRAQVVWQCDTLGVPCAYMGVLLPRLEFRGYVIHPAEGEAEFIREEARTFLDSLAEGVEPGLDAHRTTYPTLRELHPDIEHRTVDVDPALAARYSRAVLGLRAAEDEHTMARTLLADAMGSARYAADADTGVRIADRRRGPTGIPYVRASDRLPVYPPA